MKYIVAIYDDSCSIDCFIREGENFVSEKGLVYVPLTCVIQNAKRYETRKLAEKASKQKARNMLDRYTTKIIEVDENGDYRFSN